MRVLFCAADPADQSRLRLQVEHREISERLRLSQHRENIDLLSPVLAARTKDFLQSLLEQKPEVVHFSGHGSAQGLCFEDEKGDAANVTAEALSSLFSLMSDTTKCVVLNACESLTQARAISEKIDYVIGMTSSVSDSAAISFSIGFYTALVAGRSFEDAFGFGKTQVMLDYPAEADLPFLLKRNRLGAGGEIAAPPGAIRSLEKLVLLMGPEGGVWLLQAEKVDLGENGSIVLSSKTPTETAFLSSLRSGHKIAVVFAFTAVFLRLRQAPKQTYSDGIEHWDLSGAVDRGPFTPGLGEMSAMSLSADQLAELRARRILLGEARPVTTGGHLEDVANSAMIELFVRGFDVPLQVVESPLPATFAALKSDQTKFLAAARLTAVLWLRLSGSVDEILDLRLALRSPSILEVKFRGRRPRKFANERPYEFEVEGEFDLEKRVSTGSHAETMRFDQDERFDVFHGGIVFSGETDDGRFVCFISEEALQDHFQAVGDAESLLRAFKTNRDQILRLAAYLVRQGKMDEERRVFIRTADVPGLLKMIAG